MLKDIRVLDLADETGSFCSRLLADLGASVIKVERPGGDGSRKIGPFQSDRPGPDNSLFFAYHNANKFGITLDLKIEADRKTFLGLVKDTDVLVETFRSGYLETIGLGFETLRNNNPWTISMFPSPVSVKKALGIIIIPVILSLLPQAVRCISWVIRQNGLRRLSVNSHITLPLFSAQSRSSSP